MPFVKKGPNTYTSPSGRKFTKKQVVAYYATDGFKKKVTSGASSSKSRKGSARGR